MTLQPPIFPSVPRLPYATLCQTVASGDLLLASGTAIFSQLIQHATDSPWSHVGFLLRLETIDRIMVLESVESIGVRTVPLSQYASNYQGKGHGYPGRLFLARHTGLAAADQDRMRSLSQWAVDLFGYPYDTQTILGIAARILAGKIGLDPAGIAPNKAFICSEYVAECLQSIGVEVPYDRRGFIAPRDFAVCPAITFLAELAREED